MIGAALLRARTREPRRSRARRVSGRLVVCPTPIGNLEDVTLRVLAALRDADVVACEDTRRTRVLLERYGVPGDAASPTTSTTSASGRPSWSARMRDGAVVALVSRRGDAAGLRPRLRARAGCIAAGLEVEVLPGPSAALAALVASGAAGGRVAVRGVPAAQARRRSRRCSPRRETVVAFESPRRVGASLAVLAELDPERPGRRLPRAHQAARGGRPRRRRPSSPRATRTTPPRGEVVLVIGGAPARTGADPAAIDAVRRLIEAGARARARPPRRRRAHGRSRQRSVPSRDERRTRPHRLTPRGPPPHAPALGGRPRAPDPLPAPRVVCRPYPGPPSRALPPRRRSLRARPAPRRRLPALAARSGRPAPAGSCSRAGWRARARSACAAGAGACPTHRSRASRCERASRSGPASRSAARRAGSTSASAARAGASATSTRSASSLPADAAPPPPRRRRPGTAAAAGLPRPAPSSATPAPPGRTSAGARPVAGLARPPARPDGTPGAGRLRLPYRRQEGATCRASSTSSSSPTIPSSR